MSEWKPIETAPEGVQLLLYNGNDGCIVLDSFKRVRYERWEQINKNTKKLIEEEEIEWNGDGWGASQWMLPPSPPKPEDKP